MDGHYMITQGGRLAMFTRCWDWNRGFRATWQPRLEMSLSYMPEAALDAAWARGQVASPTSSAASGFEPPTAAELQRWADEAIAGNLYDKIMQALSQTHHYKDLNGNDVLNLISKRLCLSEDQPGYLSCRHCLNKNSPQAWEWSITSAGARTTRPTPSWLSSCSPLPLACRQSYHQRLQPRSALQCLRRRFLWRLLDRQAPQTTPTKRPTPGGLEGGPQSPEDSLAVAAPPLLDTATPPVEPAGLPPKLLLPIAKGPADSGSPVAAQSHANQPQTGSLQVVMQPKDPSPRLRAH